MPLSHEMVDGRIVSAEHLRIAEVIHDYNSELELAWIPPENRSFDDSHPFAVIHHQQNGYSYIVFKIKENELDHRVLARLFAGDVSKNDPLAILDKEDAARQLLEYKRQEDEAEERRELAAWALAAKSDTPLNGYKG